MDAREYLLNIRKNNYTIKALEMELRELRDESQRASAIDYSKDRVDGGSAVKEPAFLKALDKLEDKMEKYDKILSDYTDQREKAFFQLHLLSDGIDTEILYLKFFKDKSFEQIIRSTYYTEGVVRYHYNKGLEEFDRRKLWEA